MVLALPFLLLGGFSPDLLGRISDTVLAYLTTSWNWLYLTSVSAFVLVCRVLAYFQFRKHRPATVSQCLTPLVPAGNQPFPEGRPFNLVSRSLSYIFGAQMDGIFRKMVDALAIWATIIGAFPFIFIMYLLLISIIKDLFQNRKHV